jgi:hypothetical protein
MLVTVAIYAQPAKLNTRDYRILPSHQVQHRWWADVAEWVEERDSLWDASRQIVYDGIVTGTAEIEIFITGTDSTRFEPLANSVYLLDLVTVAQCTSCIADTSAIYITHGKVSRIGTANPVWTRIDSTIVETESTWYHKIAIDTVRDALSIHAYTGTTMPVQWRTIMKSYFINY